MSDTATAAARGDGYETMLADQRKGPAKGSQVMKTAFAVFLLVMFVANVAFIFGLPLWSYLLNDYWGLAFSLCETPADQLTCGVDKTPYLAVALKYGRVKNGQPFGCACEDGVLQDWACPIDESRFSISYFISAAPGTGAMAALSAWPITSMWLFGAGAPDRMAVVLKAHPSTDQGSRHMLRIRASLVFFQFFYGLFLINTVCIFGEMHGIAVGLFMVSLIAHFSFILCAVDINTVQGKVITTALVAGILGFAIGFFYPVSTSLLGQYAFWLGECIGLTCAYAVAPILMLYSDLE